MLHNVLSRSFHLEVTDRSATVGTPVIYSAIHQFGARNYVSARKATEPGEADRESSGIPARPYFPVENGRLTPKAEEKIRAAGERAMTREIEG